MKILQIVGARPQFVKLSPVDRALRLFADVALVHTGQHYDHQMSAVFFDRLGLPAPDFNLNVGSGSHGAQTADMVRGLERVMISDPPDLVVVFGDTNSTLAGALVAAKLQIPIAHIEAGLRSMDRTMPEEINRIVTDHLSELLFCPTESSVVCLAREGVTRGVHLVGDVMYDAVVAHAPIAEQSAIVDDLDISGISFALVTVHRAGNTDDPVKLRQIVAALNALPMVVVFPMHPRTRQRVTEEGLHLMEHIRLIDPVDYFEMLALERRAAVILTDSGGMQKEAYFLGTPCVTLRENTEWMETVEAGWNVLVGTDPRAITQAAMTLRPTHARPTKFGNGTAAAQIAKIIEQFLLDRSTHDA